MTDSVQLQNKLLECDLRQLLQQADPDRGVHYGMQGDAYQSYAQLAESAEQIALGLLAEGVTEGDQVVVMIGPPQRFLESFWGCVLAGAQPVPLQPGATDEAALKVLHVAQVLVAPWLISETGLAGPFDKVARYHGLDEVLLSLRAKQMSYQALVDSPADAILRIKLNAVGLDADSTAFIQFSSGSTGEPKGVVLTHRRVVAHLADLGASCEATRDDVFLSWFPLTHDMGMVLMHLLPLALGANQVQIETKSFVQRPRRWLTRASELKATVLCTNNFGLKHFLKLTGGKAPLTDDLSQVRLMFNAAEPISAELWETFMDLIAGTHLPRAAMYPGYGLAEATLAVTVPVPGDGLRTFSASRAALGPGDTLLPPSSPQDAVQLVDVGRAVENTSLRIAGWDDGDLGENRVGEIQLQSRSAAQSYLNAPRASLYTADGWLKTGDLGVLRDGRLFITGRIKEMITLGGENFYPHDIERVAETVPGVELGKVVATSVFDLASQAEQLLIFLYSRRIDAELAGLTRAVQQALAALGGWKVDRVIPIGAVPKTSSGKIRRGHLGQQYLAGAYDDSVASLEQLQRAAARRLSGGRRTRTRQVLRVLQASAAEVLGRSDLDIRKPLVDQGFNSARAMALVVDAGQTLGRDIPVAFLYDYPTLLSLAEAISLATPEQTSTRAVAVQPKITIAGLGCRFPGGIATPEAFRTFLSEGRSAIGPLPDTRAPRGLPRHKRPVAAFLDEIDGFDPELFGISWAEAKAMDPQQRLLLEVCWEALERAGLSGAKRRAHEIGVFVGIGPGEYGLGHETTPNQHSYTGTAPAIAAGRIAYALGLRGPAMVVDTACSSALVAVHLAVQSLIAGECDTAIAAGVNLILGPDGHAKLEAVSALSPTGQCRAFDDEADGYVRGEGCGAVVLRLADQLCDGEPSVAMITGTALNQDGRSGGLTVPSGPAQGALINHALARAGLAPADIAYIETHGTGTPLGDPIEANALTRVFGPSRSAGKPLLIGSAKTNLGHLEAAAGMVGLIKAALCVQSGTLPASLNHRVPNHRIDWTNKTLEVVTKPRSWPETAAPRRAGVSAFGLSGTNAHVIVEQAERQAITDAEPEEVGPLPVLTFSAADPQALRTRAGQLTDYLETHPDLDLTQFCSALAHNQADLTHLAAGAVSDIAEAETALRALAEDRPGPIKTGRKRGDALHQIAFVFTGQGSQWAGMGVDLLERSALFASEIERIDALLLPLTGWTVRDTLTSPDAANLLRRTDRAQAAIFAVQAALVRMLEELGLTPDAVIGHSVGEIAAHYASGVLSLEESVRLVAHRGKLMQAATGRGRMLAVPLGEEAIAPHLAAVEGLDLAAVNSPDQVVLSGDQPCIDTMTARLKNRNIPGTDLGVDYAFHGRHVQSEAKALAEQLGTLSPLPPLASLYSTVTGTLHRSEDVNAAYWAQNIGGTVRFAEAMQALLADGCTDIVEIGPHPALSSAITACIDAAGGGASSFASVPTLRRNMSGARAVADTLASLTCRGLAPNWTRLSDEPTVLTDLPTYPWQHKRFWLDGYDPWAALTDGSAMDQGALYTTAIRPLTMPLAEKKLPPLTLTHGEGDEQAAVLACALAELVATERNCRIVALTGPADGALEGDGWFVHLTGTVSPDRTSQALADLATAIQASLPHPGSRLWCVTFDPMPDKASPDALEAFSRVAAREHPELNIVRARLAGQADLAGLAALLRSDMSDFDADELRLEGPGFFTERIAPVEEAKPARTWMLRGDASYLISGGTGGVGLALAEQMLDAGAGQVVLTGRAAPGEAVRTAMQRLNAEQRRLEAVAVDASDRAGMSDLIRQLRDGALPLRGVVHAAAVLRDGTIHSMTSDLIAEVAAPKVAGGWVLHDLTRDIPLDYFICLSSIATLIGSPGQGAYAAANGGLDALARFRAAQELPSLSLQLGPVADLGMMAEGEATRRDPAALGLGTLQPDLLLGGVEQAWETGLPVVALAEFDPAKWTEYLPDPGNRARLSELVATQTATGDVRPAPPQQASAGTGRTQLKRIAALPAVERPQALMAEIAAIIEAVDQTPADLLDPDASVQDLGISSLTLVELRKAIEARFACPVPVTSFFEFPTIRSFAGHLVEMLNFGDEAAENQPEASKPTMKAGETHLTARDALRSKLEKYR
ncbi:SDR family NAD(P)-dependent oxidoreductase [Ruegeria sp. 2205SS24-7]|uniref:SDR family NAD(P)-dependent oxidoreductase n=1 Tax=Ruegeria discodermiae TaxID=3064389 RepID=UPI0027418270|nr:SDR family NAD(P)-dependent oxidoreductase [Ruegeria sp. 2205SS24-7]MDP5218852.1 SDR family NAD(P)-dependent oxidoreductase [Ruegeria sp. 2205SS24-7]